MVEIKFSWPKSFSDEIIAAPFTVKNDIDYYPDLRKRYTHFIKLLEKAHADEESIKIAKRYSDKICEALRDYYRGSVSSCHQKIHNLILKCGDDNLAVTYLMNSAAFPGQAGDEIQFFRARLNDEAKTFTPKEMLHLPFGMRGKSGNYRFSIPGVISLYVANSTYCCWIEMGKPSEHDFNVSPIIFDGKQRIFNLAVMTRDLSSLNDCSAERVHTWIKLLILMFATSYRIEESNRSFKSEYIISQSIMLACKKLGYDGVAYFSKRVDNEMFARVAVNLALFADYKQGIEYGDICNHIKIAESMNYQFFRQLDANAKQSKYPLRVDNINYVTNIGHYKRQYKYDSTEFYKFDKHLFEMWRDKDEINFGNALE